MTSPGRDLLVHWLTEHNICWRNKTPWLTGDGHTLTGVCIGFQDAAGREFTLSVETHQAVAGAAFAETAVLNEASRVIYPRALGYHHNVISHASAAALIGHVQEVLARAPAVRIDEQPPECLLS